MKININKKTYPKLFHTDQNIVTLIMFNDFHQIFRYYNAVYSQLYGLYQGLEIGVIRSENNCTAKDMFSVVLVFRI